MLRPETPAVMPVGCYSFGDDGGGGGGGGSDGGGGGGLVRPTLPTGLALGSQSSVCQASSGFKNDRSQDLLLFFFFLPFL